MKTNLLMLCWVVASGCALTTHPVKAARLGTPSSTKAMLALIDEPGPLSVESVASVDWAVPRSGVINLDHPSAKAAGLTDGDEPIQVFFHVIRHPTRGTFIIDTGVEKALRDAPEKAAIQGVVASFFHLEKMKFNMPLGDFLAHEKLDGVLLTHVHLDHVTGMPDVPHGTPIYSGPGDTAVTALANTLMQPNLNRALAGQDPISEWQYTADPDGRFAGVLDVFGDGSLWAIWTPGHTPGSTAYVARTANGPVLITGDDAHTAWGWEHDVEGGTYTGDHAGNAASLEKLKALAAEHPAMSVRLGHQTLAAK
jgi:N-acyl homoserine lactone hydrolase